MKREFLLKVPKKVVADRNKTAFLCDIGEHRIKLSGRIGWRKYLYGTLMFSSWNFFFVDKYLFLFCFQGRVLAQ